MKYFARFTLAMALAGSMFVSQVTLAQNTPGSALAQSAVATDIATLFQLAEQAYPSLFGNTSGWRSHGGYTYQYYAAGKIYAGVKDGNVYLLGGPFGSSIVQKGALSVAIGALQATIAKQTTGGSSAGSNPGGSAGDAIADFSALSSYRTLAQLIATFKVISFEYSTTIGTLHSVSQVKLAYEESGMVNGVVADHITVSLSGGSIGSTAQDYTMWVDRNSKILRLIHPSGLEYTPQTSAELIGKSLVSGFLLALVATDAPYIATALAGELQSPAVSQKIATRAIGKEQARVITITTTNGNDSVIVDIADLGAFSMATRLEATGAVVSSSIETIELELR